MRARARCVQGEATVFACTNASTSSQTVGVEVYGAGGTFVADDSLTVAPNATVLFATDAIPNVAWDVNMNVGVLSKGSARIMASSSKGIICTACWRLV